MNNLTLNLMLATAALMVASSVAPAQTMKAQIPFAFRSAGKTMAAGTYLVRTTSAGDMFQLTDLASGNSILLMPAIRLDPPKAWQAGGGGVLQFACSDNGCSLKRIWTDRGSPVHEFTDPNGSNDKPIYVAAVRMVIDSAK